MAMELLLASTLLLNYFISKYRSWEGRSALIIQRHIFPPEDLSLLALRVTLWGPLSNIRKDS